MILTIHDTTKVLTQFVKEFERALAHFSDQTRFHKIERNESVCLKLHETRSETNVLRAGRQLPLQESPVTLRRIFAVFFHFGPIGQSAFLLEKYKRAAFHPADCQHKFNYCAGGPCPLENPRGSAKIRETPNCAAAADVVYHVNHQLPTTAPPCLDALSTMTKKSRDFCVLVILPRLRIARFSSELRTATANSINPPLCPHSPSFLQTTSHPLNLRRLHRQRNKTALSNSKVSANPHWLGPLFLRDSFLASRPPPQEQAIQKPPRLAYQKLD